jgi:hypothetical protein
MQVFLFYSRKKKNDQIVMLFESEKSVDKNKS